jgi:hypothetical protein
MTSFGVSGVGAWARREHTAPRRATVVAVCHSGRVSTPFPERTFPEPTAPAASRTDVFLTYLEYFRSTLVSKLGDLPDGELRRSRLPSGWTPLELLKHLEFVEMRWLEWGFEGLERVLFHLLQEYARHVGHIDIVAELAGGPTGE